MQRYQFTVSRRKFEAASQYLPGGVHYNFHRTGRKVTIAFQSGVGSRLWDYDGNEHLDLFCKFGALIVGHQHPGYSERLKQCIDTILCVDQAGLEQAVCEKLVELIPCAEMVRFGLSGTEIIQNMIRLARAFTGREKIIRFQGHYHGNADNIMGGRASSAEEPWPVDFEGDVLGTEGRAACILESQSLLLPWNDLQTLEQTLSRYGSDVALILMEPGCINGGGILPQNGYLEGVRSLSDRYGILLAFDEVITGFRVALSGAQSLFGVTPDLAVFGKALAGGAVPVSALVGRREILRLYTEQRVVHGGTFNGYALGLAAVRATVDILQEDPDCYARMGRLLGRIAASLRQAASAVGLPMVVQGFSTALVYHVSPRPLQRTTDYRPQLQYYDAMVRLACEAHGIQIAPNSRLYSNIMLTEDDVAFFEDRIGDALLDAERSLA